MAQSTSQNEPDSESSRDFSTQGRAVLRVAGRKSGESRWVRAFYRAGRVTLSSVGNVLHMLWLEVTGFLFLVLAIIGFGAAFREYRRYSAGATTSGKVVLAAGFALLFAYFGLNSFFRSHRKSKR